VKDLLLLAVLALVVTPRSVYAVDCKQSGDQQGNNNGCKAGIGANEKFGIGVGGAVLIGVAGYLLLRRRRAA
jgi:LPXTG-motif cell wall-anchored protein